MWSVRPVADTSTAVEARGAVTEASLADGDRSRDVSGDVPSMVGYRRRGRAGTGFVTAAALLSGGALVLAWGEGFANPLIAGALAAALVGANLAPLVADSGGRIDAFTPVGALLVPIGVLLPLPEAIVTYAVGESLGVVLAHRWDGHVGGPENDALARTGFVVGKSVLGAAVGLLAIAAVTGPDPDVGGALLAALVGVGVSTATDHTILAVVTAVVRGVRVWPEMARGAGELALIASGEVVAGALIAALALRDRWSFVLGLVVIGLLVLIGAAYARARTEREHSRELLALAEQLQYATETEDVERALLASVHRLLPEDPIRLRDEPPGEHERGWSLTEGDTRRWLVTPVLVDTRDYEQQPRRLVEAAIALADVALTRAAAQERLVRQDQMRSLILATVAHDLRSPLATAGTALETLAHQTRSDETTREIVAAARRGVERVQRLMDDLLSLELVDSAATPAGYAPVAATVRSLLDDLELPDVEVRFDGCEGDVALDAVSLGRIVENLALNAAKYSPPGGLVTVRCEPARGPRDGEARGVRISVEDQGPGVAEPDRTAVFEPFQQGDQARGGSGLGLYIARRFVDVCGGRIWVDDAPEGGAAFHVWLPGPAPEVSPP